MGRYRRVIFEVEIEVVDPIDVAVAARDLGEEGESFGQHTMSADSQLSHLLMQAVSESLQDVPGVRFGDVNALLREADGARYPEVTLPPMRVRHDDGTLAD